MASRKTRAQIAQQTVDLLQRGSYTLPNGTTVSLGDSVHDAVQRTQHYAPDHFAGVFARRDQILAERQDSGSTRFDVVNATTLAAARKLVDSRPPHDVVCLNFASAKNPGGGFLNGSQAQEESLARASGLYACIAPMTGYYAANRSHPSCLYTDNIIYSLAVPVIRDDEDQLLAVPYAVSMVTAPAVNAGVGIGKLPTVVLQLNPGRHDAGQGECRREHPQERKCPPSECPEAAAGAAGDGESHEQERLHRRQVVDAVGNLLVLVADFFPQELDGYGASRGGWRCYVDRSFDLRVCVSTSSL